MTLSHQCVSSRPLCYLWSCRRVTTTRDDTQDLGCKRLKGEDTRTCTDANSSTHRYLAPDTPVAGAQIARMCVVQQPLGGLCRSKAAALKCFRVTGRQSKESWSRINECRWLSVTQWLERSTWLLLDVYLNDGSASVVKHSLLTNVQSRV